MVTASAAPASPPNKALHITLWVVQILLGAAFCFGGFMKSTAPIQELSEKMVWPGVLPEALVRFIGIAEVAGGLGLVLPAASRIRPVLTPLAAGGLLLIMVLAAVFHFRRGELHALPVNIVLGGLAWFIAWGRFKKAPIPSRLATRS